LYVRFLSDHMDFGVLKFHQGNDHSNLQDALQHVSFPYYPFQERRRGPDMECLLIWLFVALIISKLVDFFQSSNFMRVPINPSYRTCCNMYPSLITPLWEGRKEVGIKCNELGQGYRFHS